MKSAWAASYFLSSSLYFYEARKTENTKPLKLELYLARGFKEIMAALEHIIWYETASPWEGCLHLKNLQNMVWSFKLKFEIWVWSNKWLLRYSTFNILRSSSMVGCLHLKYLNTLLRLPKSNFKNKPIFQMWVRSDQWLLRYTICNILRSSSMGGCLHLKHL